MLISAIAGILGKVGGDLAAGALGAGVHRWFVLWLDPSSKKLDSKDFASNIEAKAYQTQISRTMKRSSIVVHKIGNHWNCRHPVKGVIATKRGNATVAVHVPSLKMKQISGRQFDTQEEMLMMREVTTDHPASAAAIQAKMGPYFEHGTPYNDTPSSHMYEVKLPPLEPPPSRFAPGSAFRNR
jgi:hypothetical protein